MLRRVLPLVAVVPFAAALTGCDVYNALFNEPLKIPLDLTSPPQDFDVTDAVASAEGAACETQDSPSCAALTAICQTSGGACTPPAMPAEFPAQVEVVPGEPPVDANQLMVDMGITEATELELALPVDVASKLAEEGIESPDLVDDVTIENVVLEWPENTLTFDAPPLDLYIANEDVGAGALDAEQLIADGKVTKVGTIGVDLDGDGTIDVGQVAGSTDGAPVAFVDGGNEAFNTAVKSASFTLVTAVPEGKGLKLKEKDGDPSTVLKPAGAGTIQLKATLVYSVSAADVVGDVAP